MLYDDRNERAGVKFNDADLANAIERHGVYSEYSFDKFAEEKSVKVDGNILSDTGELFISREQMQDMERTMKEYYDSCSKLMDEMMNKR